MLNPSTSLAARAVDAVAEYVAHAVDAGRCLIEASALVRHAEWLRWLNANLPP